MQFTSLVRRELLERRNQLGTSLLAIVLGATAIVAVRNITFYSEKAVARELDALGANILILPKSETVQDYYRADLHSAEIPEEYVTRLVMSDIQGLDNLSPKLSIAIDLRGHACTLTGILPKEEFRAKSMWQGAGIFARPEGCGTVGDVPLALGGDQAPAPGRRIIETLQAHEVLVGSDVATRLGLVEDMELEILGNPFSVSAVLPETGTVDDARVFAHLHTVQAITDKGDVVNAIEVVGCCNAISAGLVQQINRLLPEAKVVTITQVVDTQIRTNRLMQQLSLIFLIIVVLVGGASIANYMYANVHERRREIGTLVALGAHSSTVVHLFLLKASLLGLFGGVAGAVLGTVLAVILGPQIARVPVLPMPALMLGAIGVSAGVALLASYLPARQASRLDPCTALQET